jgi:putative endopeptidase
VLKDYLLVNTINAYAPYLSKPFVDADFAFNQTTLSGTPQNSARWKRGVNLVKDNIGEDLGKAYVDRYFTPETKAAADALVKNVIAAMGARLNKLEWMAPETKAKALEKLAAFTPKIGYPTKWRDYSALEIKRGDLVGNVRRANIFEWQRGLNKLGKPLDRSEWFMTPMEINAYANPVMNEIVFPAAILQPPFFDPNADPAVNYGGIGAVIGHELSHHFDDQGRKYDMHGALVDWWTPEDVKRFTALTDKVVKQYDGYEPLPGMHVQGALTLGENMADLAGLTVAYDAYKMSLGGKEAPVIDGMTGDQRFYLGWAQVWRRNYREANLRQRLLTDPHSPSIERVSIVRNMDPFYKAYDPKAGSKLYLAPADRIRVW